MNTSIILTKTAPEGFRSFTRGSFRSERAAMMAAEKTRTWNESPPVVIVLHVPESALYEESWLVGSVPTPP